MNVRMTLAEAERRLRSLSPERRLAARNLSPAVHVAEPLVLLR